MTATHATGILEGHTPPIPQPYRDRWRVGVRLDLGAARLTGCVQGGQVDRRAGASVELTLKLASERGVVVSSEVDDRAALDPVPVLVFAEVNGDADAWFVFIEDDGSRQLLRWTLAPLWLWGRLVVAEFDYLHGLTRAAQALRCCTLPLHLRDADARGEERTGRFAHNFLLLSFTGLHSFHMLSKRHSIM